MVVAAAVAVVALTLLSSAVRPATAFPGSEPSLVRGAHGAVDPLTLTSPNVQGGGDFGYSVATSGGTTVVAAPGETVSGDSEAGHVYLYSSTKGTLLQTLTSPNPVLGGLFGYSVAVSGKTVVVGAAGEVVGGLTDAGRVYLFSTSGHLLTTLVSPDPQTAGFFGYRVAISGSKVVVGAPGQNVSGQYQAGVTYVFTTGGALVSTLTSPKALYYGDDPKGWFGFSVAITGSTVVVGAPEESSPAGNLSGHVYLYKTNGALLGTLTSPRGTVPGDFGWSVAISGSTVAVGAPEENGSTVVDAGNAYLFNAKTDALLVTLTSPNVAFEGAFGYSVAISGSSVVVGAPAENASSVPYSGHTYEFTTSGALSATFVSPNALEYGDFGYSVTISASVIGVGAPGQAPAALGDAGNAYLF